MKVLDRKLTLCTYEAPAARHTVDEWRARMGARIARWDAGPGALETVEVDGGADIVYLVPVTGDRIDRAALTRAVLGARAWRPCLTPFGKLLHFGKVPLGDPCWATLPGYIWYE